MAMNDDGKSAAKQIERVDSKKALPSRRELVRKLGKAAALPIVIGSFLAADVSDAAAN